MTWLRNKLARFIYGLWAEEKHRRYGATDAVINIRADTACATYDIHRISRKLAELTAIRNHGQL